MIFENDAKATGQLELLGFEPRYGEAFGQLNNHS